MSWRNLDGHIEVWCLCKNVGYSLANNFASEANLFSTNCGFSAKWSNKQFLIVSLDYKNKTWHDPYEVKSKPNLESAARKICFHKFRKALLHSTEPHCWLLQNTEYLGEEIYAQDTNINLFLT